MSGRSRHLLLRAAACLLVGCFINFGIATVIAGKVHRSGAGEFEMHFGERDWPVSVPKDWPKFASTEMRSHWAEQRRLAWAGGDPSPGPAALFFLERHEFGWPWPALEVRTLSESRVNFDGTSSMDGEKVWELRRSYRFWFRNELPYLPVWPGFLWNSLLCGGLVMVLAAGAMVVRRRLRQSRSDMCKACGYSLIGLAGSKCPECGA